MTEKKSIAGAFLKDATYLHAESATPITWRETLWCRVSVDREQEVLKGDIKSLSAAQLAGGKWPEASCRTLFTRPFHGKIGQTRRRNPSFSHR